MSIENRELKSLWNYSYHLPQDRDWKLSSYKTIINDIHTIDMVKAIVDAISDKIICYCMLFVMRKTINPMWEDPLNRNGGCFSYKVNNTDVPMVWKDLLLSLCGNTLTVDPSKMKLINGITISPKKEFCIIKIWLRDCTLQDTTSIIHINNLSNSGSVFKKHQPEY